MFEMKLNFCSLIMTNLNITHTFPTAALHSHGVIYPEKKRIFAI